MTCRQLRMPLPKPVPKLKNLPSSKLRQPSPRAFQKAGTAGGHGRRCKICRIARQGLGLPEETFYVSDEVRPFFEQHKAEQIENRQQWDAKFSAWQAASPDKAALLSSGLNREVPADLMDQVWSLRKMPKWPPVLLAVRLMILPRPCLF